jgi:4-hydroxybenzoate polyprenyltransferase
MPAYGWLACGFWVGVLLMLAVMFWIVREGGD